METDWKKKYEDQLAVTQSLKRDLAALQGRTVQPCPAAKEMGVHACSNQHECWEPCGVMGNDERFVRQAPGQLQAQNDAAMEALGIRRQINCDTTFQGVRIVGEQVPTFEPLLLPIQPPVSSHQRRPSDDGNRRRRTDH